jgi:hypothetical protein
VLLAAGCAEARKDWRGERHLQTPEGASFWLDRYNAAERAAEQQKREQRQQERQTEEQRVQGIVAEERAAKYSAFRALPRQELPPV